MTKKSLATLVFITTLASSLLAQPGRMSGPSFSGPMAKLFGDNTTFSADLEIQVVASGDQNMTMPGKIDFDSGKSRFEMNLSDAKGGNMPAGAADQMKAMGMDKTIAISRPDKKLSYLVYPGLSAYAEMPLQNPEDTKPDSAFKVETTELGKETIDGHACVKNKIVVTDDQGTAHTSTVWNATDLKKFPVKIEATQGAHSMTMTFKNVKIAKPDSSVFEAPGDYKKYDNVQTMMMQEMMKHAGMGAPAGHP